MGQAAAFPQDAREEGEHDESYVPTQRVPPPPPPPPPRPAPPPPGLPLTSRSRAPTWARQTTRPTAAVAAASRKKRTINIIFAKWSIGPCIDLGDLAQMFTKTLAHVVVAIYVACDSDQQLILRNLVHNHVSAHLQDRWTGQFATGGAMFTRNDRVNALPSDLTFSHGPHEFVLFRFETRDDAWNMATAVAVGAVFEDVEVACSTAFTSWTGAFQMHVERAMQDNAVRFLVGVFHCRRTQLENVCESVGGLKGVFCQKWTLDHPTAAVAAEAKWYPSLVLAFGPCHCTNSVEPIEWPNWLCDNGSFRPHLLSESYMLDPKRYKEKIQSLVDLGQIKHKPPNLDWWCAEMHQIMLWIGTSRTSKSAKAKGAAKYFARHPPP